LLDPERSSWNATGVNSFFLYPLFPSHIGP
jgi:hypothetical protein